jgi:hypothetical protein
MKKRNFITDETANGIKANVKRSNFNPAGRKAKAINKRKMYAYFAPDGYVQVRSIADTKALSREMISMREPSVTWKDYEKNGYFQRVVMVDVREQKG